MVKKSIAAMVTICLFIVCFALPVQARYSETNSIVMSLTYGSNSANCSITITGESWVTGIDKVNVALKDSSGSVVKEWKNLSCTGSTFRFNKSASLSGKGTYTLSFTGTVHGDTDERVSDSITKTYR